MILYHIKLTIRELKRNVVYSSLSILGFTIGLAVCLVIAMHLYYEYTYNQCIPNHEHIVRVVDGENERFELDYRLSEHILQNIPEVEAACPIQVFIWESFKIKTKHNCVRFETLASTTNDFFDIFSIRVLAKMGEKPFVNNHSVVITQSVATALFGHENPIGQEVTVDDDNYLIVSAVIEDLPLHSSLQGNVFINSDDEERRLFSTCDDKGCIYRYDHYLLLKSNYDLNYIADKINASIPETFHTIGQLLLQELTKVYTGPQFRRSTSKHSNNALNYLFVVLCIAILAISTINYLNFSVLLKLANLKQIGVKRIVGAKPKDIKLHATTEVMVYMLIALILAILIVGQLIPLANSLLTTNLSMSILVKPQFVFLLAILLTPVIAINILAPFLILPRSSIMEHFTNRMFSKSTIPARTILTTAQFVVSILLFATVFIVSKQINYVKTSHLGFEKEQLVKLNVPFTFTQGKAFKDQLSQLPLCQSISQSRGAPGDINHVWKTSINDVPIASEIIYADPDFIKTMAIPLLHGRNFYPNEKGAKCIINNEFLRLTGWEQTDGKKLWERKDGSGGYEVVGVTHNFHTASFHTKVEPICLILSNSDEPVTPYNVLYNTSIRLQAGNVPDMLKQMSEVWSQFIPDEPLDYTFYDTHFDSLYRKEETLGRSLWVLSVIAIALTCFGILGQVMHTAFSRTKEIGIRKVNGAKIWQVMLMLNMNFVKWVAIAFVIATPIAYFAMDKWLQNFAYRTPLSWWVFVLAGLLALVIALLTVSWQSWLAARRNPVEALRYE
ncbi:ABC transporter permease [Perlabentimonas gracilis]|uniref:ABC transporter permease n=1 Tax=Perlabentimonas gracilis TaxID=2715279 RepID=UPI0014092DA0|nr:ABC transporter permease [Perlabentimonas gracilis]NHB67941.1 FtsX-like permease family protein [Perlabentimonas gracilis]